MSILTGNEPAFPETGFVNPNQNVVTASSYFGSAVSGLTTRQQIAKDFMANMLSAETDVTTGRLEDVAKEIAKSAFILAEAFIEVNNELGDQTNN